MFPFQTMPQSSRTTPLQVFITVDTEVWPQAPAWRETALAEDLQRDIYGALPSGTFGIPFQLDMLNAYGLKAVFFVEALFACAVGLEPLRAIVEMIQAQGHEVQLHIHTEWLAWMTESLLPGRSGQNIKDFSVEEQTKLIAQGLQNLRVCGAQHVCAFRAGNYGANFDTLHALARNGLLYDTSHNTCYLDSTCAMPVAEPMLQPQRLQGLYEFPIAFFRDYPGHYRHAQLAACSRREMEGALWGAWQRGWYAFVLVSHSFELLKHRKPSKHATTSDAIVLQRFEQLCRFLAKHREIFHTQGFADLDPDTIPAPVASPPLRSGMQHTARRVVEQLAGRIL